MRIAPLADVKARLSAYVDECGAEGPVVITRNGNPPPCCSSPTMTMTWSVSCWGVRRAFEQCSTALEKA